MTLWLLRLSNSATSTLCLVLGCMVVTLFRSKWVTSHPVAARTLIPVAVVIYAVLELSFDLQGTVAYYLGRDPTLTGRTGIWNALLAVDTNPIIGVGYQSFWLGERLAQVWRALNVDFLNEAHNGYLEIYLSLGIIGLALLAAVMVGSYRRITRWLVESPATASLALSLWSVMVVYNLTESAFGASLLWTVFLFCAVSVAPQPATVTASRPVHVQGRAGSGIPVTARVSWLTRRQFSGATRGVRSASRASARFR